METLDLPKDLINIIADYAKDNTNYEIVLDQLERKILLCMYYVTSRDPLCVRKHYYDFRSPCHCLFVLTLDDMETAYPKCHEMHVSFLNKIYCDKRMFKEFIFELTHHKQIY